MEIAIYPFKTMRITQRHDEGNHLPHWKPFKGCSDKPFDEALEDNKRSYFHPFNDFRIDEKLGNEKDGFSIRLTSVNKLKIPFSKEPLYLHITLTHLNKDDFNKLRVNQIIHKEEEIIREGTSGNAKGNHFHCTANIGNYHGFKKNGNGKWCFVYDKSLTPIEAFYYDSLKTKILNSNNYEFINVNYKIGSSGEDVEKINNFLSQQVKGAFYGIYSEGNIKVFQKRFHLNETGNINLETFTKLLEKGVDL